MRTFQRLALCFVALPWISPAIAQERTPTVWRIMAVGDSITEGGDSFACYGPILAEKLRRAGIPCEFVGSRGPADARHEGYSGKDIDFLAQTVPANFARTPADIVLLHAGHNHFASERPVPGMIAAYKRLITSLRTINPRVVVLLAQVIPSGRLPKYSYLPELNEQIAHLVAELHRPDQPIILVNQAEGFDWQSDTVADHVHPNAAGAAKIADRWLAALRALPGFDRSR